MPALCRWSRSSDENAEGGLFVYFFHGLKQKLLCPSLRLRSGGGGGTDIDIANGDARHVDGYCVLYLRSGGRVLWKECRRFVLWSSVWIEFVLKSHAEN